MKCSISAIVCVFNEERTISNIIRTLVESSNVDEVIVINDGSSDGTSKELKHFEQILRLEIVEFSENRGKGYAMAEGIQRAKGDIIVFIDSDLVNFNIKYVDQLVQPLLGGNADMVIGQPTINMVFHDKLNPLKPLSGERAVFRKDILPLVHRMRESRFGVETLINLYFRAQDKRTKYVNLWGLVHLLKLQKHSVDKSVRGYWEATNQIMKTAILNYSLIIILIRNIF
ncbi:MAG: glycosyltransferase, partial [Candidatus Marinimicrobia bacterium]|nr:glycosyltransferase [Candidatus Neomarinimicrobiota bacterium]